MDALEPVAKDTPSIHQTPSKILEKHEAGRGGRTKRPPRKTENEVDMATSQYLLKLRTELRDELVKLAAINGMTIRGFIMHALKEQGLKVTDDDMVDRRKKVG